MNGASNILYKYLDPCGIKALQTMMLHASDPASFSDPFEVRPAFDQERHDYFAKTHEAFHAQFGSEYSLLGNQSMVGMPTEDAVDFGEHLNLRFRRDLSRRFRVLCLSRHPANVLMWGHYTTSHQGLVIGIDTSVTRFPQGLYQGDNQSIIWRIALVHNCRSPTTKEPVLRNTMCSETSLTILMNSSRLEAA